MGELPDVTSEDAKHLKEEHKKVTDLCDEAMILNHTWYIIDKVWYEQWEKYAKSHFELMSVEHPGPINNSGLFRDNSSEELKDHLVDEADYKVVPSKAWNILLESYGISDDQHAIERKVIEEGKYVKTTVVEVYPIPLKLCNYPNTEETIVKKFSRVSVIDDVDKEMRTLFNIPKTNETKIYNAFLDGDFQEMKKNDTISNCSLQKNQLVVIESKKPNEEWKLSSSPPDSPPSRLNGSSNDASRSSVSSSVATTSSYQLRNTSSYYDHYDRKKLTPGLCGLNNLGNTCFMNSAIQCLSNVPSLTNYFKNDKYKKDLNLDNPLGMHGKIATTYAKLIQTMWSGENSSSAPREFKYAVGQFQPRFVGYQQQDSQELMAFLIDGLHEDLNRISKKPYFEVKDAGNRPHSEVALEAWDNHRKRNDSMIVETLHGLFRSIVECPECPRVSVTFDPFCYLSLPLPVKKDKLLECTFVPVDSRESLVKYKVSVPKSGMVDDLCRAVSDLNKKKSEDMVVTDVYNNRFHKIFSSTDPIRNIYDKDVIYVFEVPPDANSVPVYLRYVSENGSCVLFGRPLLVPVHGECVVFFNLYRDILKAVFRYLVNDDLKRAIVDFLGLDEEQAQIQLKERSNPSEEPREDRKREILNLFTIKSVNCFGSQSFKEYSCDDEKAIKLSESLHLAADWDRATCEKFFTNEWEEVEDHDSFLQSSAKKNAGIDLNKCMEIFTSKEQLGRDNTWYCSNCKKHEQAFKKFDLWMLPPVLIIHLKRFSNNRYNRDKLDVFVDFPVRDLDLSEFIVSPNKTKLPKNKRRYNLIAVSNHYGGLGGGHYTAFAKNHLDQQWHYFDDSSVSLSSEDRVVTKAAYMLVYQRQDLEEWLAQSPNKPFPYFNPIFSPRAMNAEGNSGQSNFTFHESNEDALNNNTDIPMDIS